MYIEMDEGGVMGKRRVLGMMLRRTTFLHFPLVSFIVLTSSSLFLNLPFLSVHDLLKHIQLISEVNNMFDLSHFL